MSSLMAKAAQRCEKTLALAEGVSQSSRLLRVVVVDFKAFDFTLAKALPAAVPWPSQSYPAPRALYVRSLSTKERGSVSAAHAPTPPPAVRLSSTLVPKPVQAGEVRDGPSSCSST